MSDKEEIRNLVEKYADAVCRRDEADWSSTWCDNSLWNLGSIPPVEGKEAIVGLWVQAMSGFPFVAQLIHNGTVEVDGDKATGRWYIVEHLQFPEKTKRVIQLVCLILVSIKINILKRMANGYFLRDIMGLFTTMVEKETCQELLILTLKCLNN